VIEDPAEQRIAAELLREDFIGGVEKGRWRLVDQAFPTVDIAVTATEPDGTAAEYVFRFELTNYPAQAPMVRIWDAVANTTLPVAQRPTGNNRVTKAFQHWGTDTVYRPWDRCTGPHNSNAANLPHLAWRSDRNLMFILEDLHGILNLNARSHRLRTAA
jgi:hypothetical protein